MKKKTNKKTYKNAFVIGASKFKLFLIYCAAAALKRINEGNYFILKDVKFKEKALSPKFDFNTEIQSFFVYVYPLNFNFCASHAS